MPLSRLKALPLPCCPSLSCCPSLPCYLPSPALCPSPAVRMHGCSECGAGPRQSGTGQPWPWCRAGSRPWPWCRFRLQALASPPGAQARASVRLGWANGERPRGSAAAGDSRPRPGACRGQESTCVLTGAWNQRSAVLCWAAADLQQVLRAWIEGYSEVHMRERRNRRHCNAAPTLAWPL